MDRLHGSRTLAFVCILGWCALLATADACSPAETNSVETGAAVGAGGGSACDCADPDKPQCDPETGECVGCLEGTCPEGQYCDLTDNTCADGCNDDSDCDGALHCDITNHECVPCTDDSHCADGEVCVDGECATGCQTSSQCEQGETCCDGACRDLKTDVNSCGSCGTVCPELANASVACDAGQCVLDSCDEGWADCNLNTNDGCEWDLADGECSCEVGDSIPCYTGPVGTQGNGACADGIAHCLPDGSGWGPCGGQVVPGFDWCDDGVDNDCDGTEDNPPDEDADGWNICEGDCCDSIVECGGPELVNPGAFELASNEVDDNCDGQTDNVLGLCDSSLVSDTNDPLDFARAMDLCLFTSENPSDPTDRTWGVIEGDFRVAHGGQNPASESRAVRGGFGDNVVPLLGDRLAILSTGRAAAQNAPHNTDPDWMAFQLGEEMGTTSNMPMDWLMANGGDLPNAPGCPEPGNKAEDPMLLYLKVRVPTNANSFSFKAFFYSSEYPEWVCSPFNDFFLTLLDSNFSPGPGQSPNPADKNIAFYEDPDGDIYPLGVNLAFGDNQNPSPGLFKQCENGNTGCTTGAVAGNTGGNCVGVDMLQGTGFDIEDPPGTGMGGKCCCGQNDLTGGGTGWLNVSGNVEPGEIMELRMVIWDTSDALFDSLVLLDSFVWSLDSATPGVSE